MTLPPATYKILYNNKNITADITDHLVSLTYSDKVEGEADEFEMQLQDSEGLWQNEWYPDKGATIEAEIESNGIVLKCGVFAIDEPVYSFSRSSGDVVSIKGVSAFFTKALRTKKHTAHESKTLLEIARSIAAKHGLSIIGAVPDIPIDRVTQPGKSDLQFMQSLANTYGLQFSIKGSKMVFTDITTLEKGGSLITLTKADIEDCTITDKSAQTFKDANVQFHNPDDGKLVEYTVSNAELVQAVKKPQIPLVYNSARATTNPFDMTLLPFATQSADTLNIRTKAENKQQATRIAQSKLYKANSLQKEGSLTAPGNALLVSGVNFTLAGFGKLSGIYHIVKSEHGLNRDAGYITSLDIKQIAEVSSALYK